MKDVLRKYFGVIGLLVYYPIAVAIRIPVGIFLLGYIALVLLVWQPITRRDDREPRWVGNLYDWYYGK